MNKIALKIFVLFFIVIELFANDEFVPYYLTSNPSRNLDDFKNFKEATSYPTDNYNYKEILGNDLGAQRPVETKSVGFGYFLGFRSNIKYSNNPLGLPDKSDNKHPAGLWENSLRNNFRLGAFDLGGTSFSPILSLNLATTSFFGHKLYDNSIYKYQNSLGASFAGILQLPGNWSIRPSFSINSQFQELDLTYHEFTPTVAFGKIVPLSAATLSFDLSVSYAFAHIADVAPDLPTDLNNRFECSLITGINFPIGSFEINPLLGLTLSKYPNQDDRLDFSTILGIDLKYNFADWCSLDLSSNYSLRSSNKKDYDYSRIDLSSSASLSTRF